jgi:hypothetical protein
MAITTTTPTGADATYKAEIGDIARDQTVIVNVMTHGVTGDGETDDTAAIVVAVSALPSTGGILYFPPGKVYIMNNPSMASAVDNTIIWAYGAEFRNLSGGTGRVFTMPPKSRCGIYGAYINGFWDGAGGDIVYNSTPGSQIGLSFGSTTDCVIKDVRIYGTPADGMSGNTVTNLTIDNCITNTTGEHGIYCRTTDGATITNCQVFDANAGDWGTSGRMLKLANCGNVVVDGYVGRNTATESVKGSFMELQADNVQLRNITAAGVVLVAIVLDPDENGVTAARIPTRISFDNCSFYGAGSGNVFSVNDSEWDQDTCFVNNCVFDNFTNFELLPNVKNIDLTGGTYFTTLDTVKYSIDGVHMVTAAGQSTIRGTEGCVFRNISTDGVERNVLALYAVDSLIDGLSITHDTKQTTRTALRLNAITDGCIVRNYHCHNYKEQIHAVADGASETNTYFENVTSRECLYVQRVEAAGVLIKAHFNQILAYNNTYVFGFNSAPTGVIEYKDLTTQGTLTALVNGTGILQAHNLSGSGTLSSGTLAVAFDADQPDTAYNITLACSASETLHYTSKAAGGFTINSSNGSSTADADWTITR